MSDIVDKITNNKLKITAIIIFAVFFVYINHIHFNNFIASNSKYLVNYKQNIDELQNYREPQIAVLLYEKKSNYQKPAIIITPHSKYASFLIKKYGQNDSEIQTIILNPINNEDQITAIANANNLVPKAVELNSEGLESFVAIYNKNAHKTNIENFIKDNTYYLSDIIKKSLSHNKKPFKVTKKQYPLALFDKGNSFIYDNKTESGSLNANIGIGQDIANNIFAAKKQGLDINNFKVEIFTQITPIKYSSQDELYAKINKDSHGVVLKDGYRQAVFLPKEWKKYKSKEDFINALKIKANILPNYHSKKIKFYTFEAVEVFAIK